MEKGHTCFLFYNLVNRTPASQRIFRTKMTESNGKSFGIVLDGIFAFLAFIFFLYLWGHFYSLFGKNACSCFSNGLICAYLNFYLYPRQSVEKIYKRRKQISRAIRNECMHLYQYIVLGTEYCLNCLNS